MTSRERARQRVDDEEFTIVTDLLPEQIHACLERVAGQDPPRGLRGTFVPLGAWDDVDDATSRWALRDDGGIRDVMTLKVIVEPSGDGAAGSHRVVVRVREFFYRERRLGLPPRVPGTRQLRELADLLTRALQG